MPHTVAQFAKSFYLANASRHPVEFVWEYTSPTRRDIYTQVHFPVLLGVAHDKRGYLNRLINVIDHTSTGLALHVNSGHIGVQINTHSQERDDGIFFKPSSMFASDTTHLVRDRPLAAYLAQNYQRELVDTFDVPIEEITDDELRDFLCGHQRKIWADHSIGTPENQNQVLYLPNSMLVDAFGTEGAYHPTRAYVEPLYKINVFEGGCFKANGHVHRALDAKRIELEPKQKEWYKKLVGIYGEVGAANMLTLVDVESAVKLGSIGPQLGLPRSQYAFREIFVVDSDRNIVGHSVLDFIKLYKNKTALRDFVNAYNAAYASPSNEALRLEFHKTVKAATRELDVDQPITEDDYV